MSGSDQSNIEPVANFVSPEDPGAELEFERLIGLLGLQSWQVAVAIQRGSLARQEQLQDVHLTSYKVGFIDALTLAAAIVERGL